MPARDDFSISEIYRSISPLVQLLEQELKHAGIEHRRAAPDSLEAFSRWYLEVVEHLERHVAKLAGEPPMARPEVEMLCRSAMSGRTLRESIGVCARYCEILHPRAGRLTLLERGEEASFRLHSLRPETTTASSLCDITGLFAFYQLFQWLVGCDLRIRQVNIGPIERYDVLPFLKLFRAPVLVGGDEYALEFPLMMLDLPIVRTGVDFPAFFDLFPCGVFLKFEDGLSDRVEAILSAATRQGAPLPTQESLAQLLGISTSTLRRRLQESGKTFRQLKEACLRETALILLGRGGTEVQDIATKLGFSDTASFRRAFKQWTGLSPTAWQFRNRSTA